MKNRDEDNGEIVILQVFILNILKNNRFYTTKKIFCLVNGGYKCVIGNNGQF